MIPRSKARRTIARPVSYGRSWPKLCQSPSETAGSCSPLRPLRRYCIRSYRSGAAAYTTPNLTERERVGRDARGEAQLEQVVADLRPLDERVEPVAADADRPLGLAVDEHAHRAAAGQDEEDVAGAVVEPQPRVPAGDGPLVLDPPAAAEGELVVREPRRERVRPAPRPRRPVAAVAGEALGSRGSSPA